MSAPGHSGDRYSVVQFCHPTPWTILSPVASCVSPEQPQRYGGIPAGDRLDEVLWEINLVEGKQAVAQLSVRRPFGKFHLHDRHRLGVGVEDDQPADGLAPFQRVGVTKATPSSEAGRVARPAPGGPP